MLRDKLPFLIIFAVALTRICILVGGGQLRLAVLIATPGDPDIAESVGLCADSVPGTLLPGGVGLVVRRGHMAVLR